MKFIFFSIGLLLAISNLFGQNKSSIKLEINYPEYFKADSICLRNYNSGGSVDIAFESKQFISNNFLSLPSKNQVPVMGLFLKNNNFGISDTLYFIYGKKNCKIEFIDSFNIIRNNKILKLTNIYNFEELFSRYVESNTHSSLKNGLINNDPQKITDNKLQFVRSNLYNPYTNDLFANFIINDMEVDYASLNNFYNTFYIKTINDANYKHFIEKAIKSKIISNSENVKVPPFTVKTLNNKIISSSDLNEHYVLLNFWATWCLPCREEIPAIKRISELYSEKKLKIISISMDNNLMLLQKMIKEKKLNWTHVHNDKTILKKFGINPIPHTFLIDKKGFIIYNSLVRKDETMELKVLTEILQARIKE